jgi:hypothetical protein
LREKLKKLDEWNDLRKEIAIGYLRTLHDIGFCGNDATQNSLSTSEVDGVRPVQSPLSPRA